jgi:hypothetical protein
MLFDANCSHTHAALITCILLIDANSLHTHAGHIDFF